MRTRTVAAAATAAVILAAGCATADDPEPDTGAAPETAEPGMDDGRTERQAVTPFDVRATGPTQLAMSVPSCNGDPELDILEEDDEEVRVQVVTNVVIDGGDEEMCLDGLTVALDDPLDGRTVIDLVSGETVTVEELNPSDSQSERRPVTPTAANLASPTELVVDVPSCNGDPVVDELEEDEEQVRIRIVTTVPDSGDDCLDGLVVTLDDPLDNRTFIDLDTGQPIDVNRS